jgi:hypothetical protein
MATVSVGEHRERLTRLLERGEAYAFLTLSDPYVRACPDDHLVRLMMIREYLKVGLVTPARELVDIPGSETPAEIAALRDQLTGLRGEGIDWSSRTPRFERNLTALAQRGADVSPIANGWLAARDRFELFQDSSRNQQVRWHDDGRWRWIPLLGDHRAIAQRQPLPDDARSQVPGPYLFEGIDLGWYFERVYAATRDTFLGFSCALFVVEPDPVMLAVVFHLHDWEALLADRRVLLFTGPGWRDALLEIWETDPDLPLASRSFKLSNFRPGCSPSALEVAREAGRKRERFCIASREALEARYSTRDVRYWSERFDSALVGDGKPLRILAAVSTHTTFLKHSMRDAQRALEALGHRCVVLSEATPYQVTGPLTFYNAIRDLDPDLFFIIDHVRPEFRTVIPDNLPVLTWDQDCLPNVMTKANLDQIARHDFLIGCSKTRFLGYGYDGRQYMPTMVPTCPEQFSGAPLSNEEWMRYACDASYVSHASQTPEDFHAEERARQQDPRAVEFLDTLYRLMPAALQKHGVASGALCAEVIRVASHSCGIEIRDAEFRNWLFQWYLWRLGDRMFRHEALEWAAGWARATGRSLRIYGNGWDRHPTLSAFAAGPANNGRELLCIHRASKINLQIMPAGLLHQRSLDGLAGGGFFLARATPGDSAGAAIRRAYTRIEELGLRTTKELFETTDSTLRSLLTNQFGEWYLHADEHDSDILGHVRTCADQFCAADVFPRLSLVLFGSESEFTQKAEHFLEKDEVRHELTEEMRQAVVEQFSYVSVVRRALSSMAEYLRAAAVRNREP